MGIWSRTIIRLLFYCHRDSGSETGESRNIDWDSGVTKILDSTYVINCVHLYTPESLIRFQAVEETVFSTLLILVFFL